MEFLRSKITNFINSIWFSVALCYVTFLSFALNTPFLGFYILVLALLFIGLTKSNFKSFIPIIILMYGNHQTFNRDYSDPWFIGVLIIFTVALILNTLNVILDFKRFIKPLKKDFVFYGLIAIFITMFLSLINTPTMKESWLGILLFYTVITSYMMTRGTVDINEENKDYIVLSILFCGLTLSFEVIFILISRLASGYTMEQLATSKALSLGWANINHVAAFINVCGVLTIYYSMKHNDTDSKVFTTITLAIFCFISVISMCRGGFLGLFVILPLCLAIYITSQIKKKITFKKDLPYQISFFILIGIEILILHFTGFLEYAFETIKSRGFNLSNRDDVYKIAWEQFLAHPFFGSGVYTSRYYLEPLGGNLYNYHNYYLQILATCGILGGLAFTFYLVFSIKRVLKKDLFSIFMLIITLYFLVHGALDTLYFNTYIMCMLVALLAMNEDSKLKEEFPILFKRKENSIDNTVSCKVEN